LGNSNNGVSFSGWGVHSDRTTAVWKFTKDRDAHNETELPRSQPIGKAMIYTLVEANMQPWTLLFSFEILAKTGFAPTEAKKLINKE
jgi:hypothetical protein